MKKYIITSFLLSILVVAQAQVMPSPDAATLIKNVNVPVNLYTGVASIDVPLYTVTANNGAQLPISLQYNTGGIKVAERAGVAGLGWQLNAGGSITRIMRGEPDEKAQYASTLTGINVKTHFDNSMLYDFEKDIFFFNFPGGSGKFVLEEVFSGSMITGYDVVMLPESDLKVEVHGVTVGSEINSWVITDMQGNKYYFGTVANSSEQTISNARESSQAFDPDNERQFKSTWHLTSIDYQNQPTADSIYFEYESGYSMRDERTSMHTRLTGPASNAYSLHGDVRTYYSRTDVVGRYIKKITFPKGTVEFKYGGRIDVPESKSLKTILVKDHNEDVVSEINLNHSYFDASDSYFKNGTGALCWDEVCKRLKLESIVKDGITIRTFDYANDKSFNSSGYDSLELPPRNSLYYDHYGYFNGTGTSAVYERYHFQEDPDLNGMPRDPTFACKANMLTKVVYPTGGYTTFDYGYNQKNGGVRIERIMNFNERQENVSDQSYTYQLADENDPVLPEYIVQLSTGNTSSDFDPFAMSEAASLVFDLNGPSGGYSKVRVTDNKTSIYSDHFFVDLDDIPLMNANKHTMRVNFTILVITDTDNFTTDFIAPYTTRTLQDYLYGVENQVITYDANGKKISSSVHVYEQSALGDSIVNHQLSLGYVNGNDANYHVSQYMIKTRNVTLDSTVTSTFDDNEALIAETTTKYEYHPTYKSLPIQVTTTRTDATGGEAFNSRNSTKYASDAVDIKYSQAVLNDMVTANMIAIPVQTENEIQMPGEAFKTAGSNVTTFWYQNGMIQPYQTHVLNLEEPDNGWTTGDFEIVDTKFFNANGLISSQEGADGVVTQYLYDEYGYVDTVTVVPGGSLPNRTTAYTYEPLVGIKKVTDPNGRSTTYEYDRQNRLLLVRDKDDNIVKRNRYSYANDDEIDAQIEISGPTTVSSGNVTFDAVAPSMYGVDTDIVEYKWTIDNTDYTTKSVSRSFSSHGTKDVQLAIINPEYDEPKVINTTLEIFENQWDIDSVFYPSVICYDSLIGPEEDPYYEGDQLSVTIDVGGFSCETNGGFSYNWQWSNNQAQWSNFEEGYSSVLNFPEEMIHTAGTKYIHVNVTDACGVTKTSADFPITITAALCTGGGSSGGGQMNCAITGFPSTKKFYGEGASGSYNFTGTITDPTGFSVTETEGWMSLSNITSTGFTLSYQSTTNKRTGVITISTDDGCSDTITVTQYGASSPCPFGCYYNYDEERCWQSNSGTGNPPGPCTAN